jgi:hypothetical protein
VPRSKQLRNIIDDENKKQQKNLKRGPPRPNRPPNEPEHMGPPRNDPRGRDDFEMNRPPPMREGQRRRGGGMGPPPDYFDYYRGPPPGYYNDPYY